MKMRLDSPWTFGGLLAVSFCKLCGFWKDPTTGCWYQGKGRDDSDSVPDSRVVSLFMAYIVFLVMMASVGVIMLLRWVIGLDPLSGASGGLIL